MEFVCCFTKFTILGVVLTVAPVLPGEGGGTADAAIVPKIDYATECSFAFQNFSRLVEKTFTDGVHCGGYTWYVI